MRVERHRTDILILGSGGAGLLAALHAKQTYPDAEVTVAVKGLLGKSGCTRMVQGGYNVAIAPEDSVERHFMDTIVGGKWLPRQDLAWRLVEGAVERIRELENEIGCFFDRNPDGTIHQKAFAGQSFDRTVHKGDLTGIEIINRVMEQVLAHDVRRLEEHRAIELIPARDGSGLAGVLMIDVRTGAYRFVAAKAVLLATGAGPTMYLYHTPSGDKSCDGLAMALRAGLVLRDMEMVQVPSHRAAGRSRYPHDRHRAGGGASRGRRPPAERRRRAVHGTLRPGRGARDPRLGEPRHLRGDARRAHHPDGWGVHRDGPPRAGERRGGDSPGMVKRCADCGFDLAGGRVEVVPTAHYMMGGVEFEADCATALPRLYAAGEDCGGVHGANRLGGNGVANSTVYGGIAGETMARAVRDGASRADPDEAALDAGVARAERPFSLRGDGSGRGLGELRERLWRTMWDDVGVLRTREGVERGLDRLDAYASELLATGLADGDRAFNLTWHDWLNLESLVEVSRTIARAALAREDSRGAHFREDFPETGDLDTSRYIRVSHRGDDLHLDTAPVEFSIVRPGESLIDGEAGAPAAAGEHSR